MNIWLYLLAINVFTYAVYWLDKRAARHGSARIPEMFLLMAGFIGGTVGAFFAQHIIRHKNRKARFQLGFWVVTVIQLYLIFNPPQILIKILSRVFA